MYYSLTAGHPFRPILPKNDLKDDQGRRDDEGNESVPKRRNVSVACEICRKKKSKCDGKKPTCSRCSVFNLICEYRERNQEAQKRRLEEVSRAHDDIKTVIELIRNSSIAEVETIMRHIRESPSVEDAIESIRYATLLLPDKTGGSASDPISLTIEKGTAYPSTSSFSPKLLPSRFDNPDFVFEQQYAGHERRSTAENLIVDIPSIALPVSKWISATQDDGYLTHLLTLFFTWDNTVSHMVDRAAFMEDLKSIDRDIANQRQSFCTPFLVNAMLAMGCAHSVNYQYSTGLKSNAEEGLRFSSEARRIIESECPGPSIPLLQTYCLLWFFDGVCGDGTLAVQYFNDACEVYRQLMGNFEGSLHPNQREQTRHRATLHALWGFWCTNAKSCLAFGEPAKDVPQPREGYRPTFPDDDSRYWFAYPVSLKPFDSHLEELFLAEQNLSKIVHDLLVTCQEVKRATSQIHKDVFAASYTRLLDWKAQLPNYLKVEESVLPSVMVLHSTFEVAAMILLEPMAMAKFPPLERQLDPVALSEAHAASAMAIIWKYRSMYSLRHEYWFCQGCVSAAKAVIQKLVPGTPYVDIFVKACQALREIGDNVNVANQYLRVIRALLTAHKVKLPKALVQYLTGLETLAGTAYIDKAYMSVDSKSVTKGSSSLEKDLFTVSELIQSYDDAVVDVE